MNAVTGRPRVFISHSSKDRAFVRGLAEALRNFSLAVWYDDWEIAVGDSIVDKVFEGLDASDNLVIVLSAASVASRWVKEELNVAVMRRLSQQNIRIFPVLCEDCEIPTALRHIKYADCRPGQANGLAHLLEAITPAGQLQDALRKGYEKLAALCDQLEADHDGGESNEKLLQIYSLLESALGIRIEIEFRRTPEAMRPLDLFEKIETLADRGIDVRSETWNALVYVRSMVAHATKNELWIVGSLLKVLRQSDKKGTLEEEDEAFLRRALRRFKDLMRRLCFEYETSPRKIVEEVTQDLLPSNE